MDSQNIRNSWVYIFEDIQTILKLVQSVCDDIMVYFEDSKQPRKFKIYYPYGI